mmetsp:Transcript_60758/g.124041  ORF Transcript_60758/g.124041 Transcript_60758/m.124041 type:complete len:99 (+) Transcript_60758:427-723(+)
MVRRAPATKRAANPRMAPAIEGSGTRSGVTAPMAAPSDGTSGHGKSGASGGNASVEDMTGLTAAAADATTAWGADDGNLVVEATMGVVAAATHDGAGV